MNAALCYPSAGQIRLEPVDVIPDATVLLRRSKRYRSGNGQRIAQVLGEALEIAQPLLEPDAIWALKPVDLESRRWLPPLSEATFSKITLHFGVVCTIGLRLESRSHLAFQEQHFTLGYWLDQIGTYSVSILAQVIANRLCSTFGAVRWAPGDSQDDQDFTSQQELFNWVPAEKIGVRLTGQNMMSPVKSLSFNLYAGPDLHGVECMVLCSHCVWNGACDRQR